ncbi:hypothetical protein PJI17_19705 [Mycobacterium kansasii]
MTRRASTCCLRCQMPQAERGFAQGVLPAIKQLTVSAVSACAARDTVAGTLAAGSAVAACAAVAGR